MTLRTNKGFTLQEMLIVVAIIAIVTIIIASVGLRLQEQAKIKSAENTLQVVSAALERYYSKHGQYPFEAAPYLPYQPSDDTDDIGFMRSNLPAIVGGGWQNSEPDFETANYQSSIEGLYRKLNSDADTAKIIAAVPDKYLTAKNSDKKVISLGGEPLIRIVDPWGNPYRYMYESGYGVAIVESAGPDGEFGRSAGGEDPDEDKKNDDNISF